MTTTHVAGEPLNGVQLCRRCGAVIAEWSSLDGFLSGSGPMTLFWPSGTKVAVDDGGAVVLGTLAPECVGPGGAGGLARAIADAKAAQDDPRPAP